MRKFYLILLSMCSMYLISAQNKVAGYEYWFNDQFDQKVNIDLNDNETVDLQLDIDATTLNDGMHQLNLMCYDTEGKYSSALSGFFFKMKISTVTQNSVAGYRYWFDQETTYTDVDLNTGALDDIVIDLDLNNRPPGPILLHLQTYDATGYFSSTISRFITGRQSDHMQQLVYWFNGNAMEKTTVELNHSKSTDLNTMLDVSGLPTGINQVNLYATDDQGQVSTPVSALFYKLPGIHKDVNEIEKLTFWYDENCDAKKEIIAESGSEIIMLDALDAQGLTQGLHQLNWFFSDSRNMYSSPGSVFFFKAGVSDNEMNLIKAYEYWLDNDFNNRIIVQLDSALNPADLMLQPDFSELTQENHTFNFRSQDGKGLWSTQIFEVFLRDSIKIIDADRIETCEKSIVQFQNILSSEKFKFEWNFGDGNTSESAEPEHYFAKAGNYQVGLKATDLVNALDSTYYIWIKVLPVYQFETQKNIQVGSIYEWRGKVYQEEGIYFDPFSTIHGCDSIYVLNLTLSDSLFSYPKDILLSGNTIFENSGKGTLIGKFTTIDNDPDEIFTYTIVNQDTINKPFYLEGGNLLSNQVFNFEQLNDLKLTVQVQDKFGYTFLKLFQIFVMNVNEQPYAIQISDTLVSESAAKNEFIARFNTLDPDGMDNYKYSLISDAEADDNASFLLDGDKLLNRILFNYEHKKDYMIRVVVTDQGGLTYAAKFHIHVVNENESPYELTISNYKMMENQSEGSFVGKFSAMDPENDTLSYVFTSGEGDVDNDQFEIREDSLFALHSFDYEKKNTYFVRIKAGDQGGLSTSRNFTIQIMDVEDNTGIWNILIDNNLVDENASEPAFVGKLSTEGGFGLMRHFEFVIGDGDLDNKLFQIRNDSLFSMRTFNFEDRSIYFTRIHARDEAGTGMSKLMVILINDINESPYGMYLMNNNIDELLPVYSYVSQLITFDEDRMDDHSYSLAAGDGDVDNSKFIIRNDSLLTASVLHYKDKSILNLRIQTTDKGGKVYSMKTSISLNNLTGTEDLLNTQFKAFFSGDMLIIKALGHSGSRFELLDMNGKILMAEEQLDEAGSYRTHMINTGFYILNIIENNQVIWQTTIQKR